MGKTVRVFTLPYNFSMHLHTSYGALSNIITSMKNLILQSISLSFFSFSHFDILGSQFNTQFLLTAKFNV